jgi:hypothetical protein
MAKNPKGPGPSGRKYKGLPIPGWFQEESADALRSLKMRDDDVVCASLPKSGTTWVQKILYLMLHGLDDDGKPTGQPSLHAKGQVYPDALPLKAPEGPPPAEGPEAFRRKMFGDAGFEDLEAQPAPRLFSTHLARGFLPAELEAAEGGRGRLVVVVRNLKDVLSSLHYFRGEAKDGWLGNEHGPGSLARFVAPECPNAFGSSFGWVSAMDALVGELLPSGRALVLYYEDLSRSLPAQLERLAGFLGVRLSDAKRDALAEAVGFGAMKAAGGARGMLLRKGGVGDWRTHLDEEAWGRVDAAFEARLGATELAEPLRAHQAWRVGGLPPRRAEQTAEDEARELYPPFVRVTLRDGRLVRDTLIAPSRAPFVRPASEFNGEISAAGVEGGRYHLFVSGVCPWASSCRAVRALLQLQAAALRSAAMRPSAWREARGVTDGCRCCCAGRGADGRGRRAERRGLGAARRHGMRAVGRAAGAFLPARGVPGAPHAPTPSPLARLWPACRVRVRSLRRAPPSRRHASRCRCCGTRATKRS